MYTHMSQLSPESRHQFIKSGVKKEKCAYYTLSSKKYNILHCIFQVKWQQCNIFRSVFGRFNLANSTNVNILWGSFTTIQTVPHSGHYSLLYEKKLIEEKNHIVWKYNFWRNKLKMFFVKAVYSTFISSIMTFFFFISVIGMLYVLRLFYHTKFQGVGVYPFTPPPPPVFTPGNRSARIVRIPVDAVSSRCHEVTADQGTSTLISWDADVGLPRKLSEVRFCASYYSLLNTDHWSSAFWNETIRNISKR